MAAIELTSEHPVTVPTPVRVAVPPTALPGGAGIQLREAGGSAVACQRDGDGAVVFLAGPMAAGARKRYEIEAAAAGAPGVEVRTGQGHQLDILIGGKPFTTYLFDPDYSRPYFYPVLGPGGRAITRNFPMKKDVPGESKDHPHHRSHWSAYGEVGDADCWSDGANHGWIKHQGFRSRDSGPVFGGFVADNLWTNADGLPILSERRTVRFYNPGQDSRLYDYDLVFEATQRDVEFGDTKEGGIISFRVASSIDADKAGRIENANGGVGEKECWGKPAAWCDYSGPTEGKVLGIAVMDHPGNFRHPTHWHVRAYGLMGTNVFGTSSFEGGGGKRGAYTMKKGESLTFRSRVLLHEGNAMQGHVSDAYHGYIQPPVGKFAG